MLNHFVRRTIMAGFGVCVAITPGCGGESPSAPSAPSPPPTPAALSVTAISPNTGSTFGANVTIKGTGFQFGATVTADGTNLNARFFSATTITVYMPAHVGGTVDVVVSNPVGEGVKVPGGYTYVVLVTAPLSVTAVSPSVGSTGGGSFVRIAGTGFQVGATVSIDGIVRNSYVHDNTSISLTTHAHTLGTVDLVVTNPDGQTARLTRGYTYASPASFDFNGDWEGWAGDARLDQDPSTPIRVVIQNNVVVSVSCGSASNLTFLPPPPAGTGDFSFAGSSGEITGRILSAKEAYGTINIAPCLGYVWWADRP